MGALTDLWKSEKGLLCLFLIIAATVLASLGRMPIEMWYEFAWAVFATYVVGKTATGVASIIKGKPLTEPASDDTTTEDRS